ncbi:MAG TPA: RNA 2',3'-cyclic phosphodiesterase [Stellaceae bacterium]|jgi:2'-5' RNA ligase|nr:RNA 2',3'-cyclic phosphodiesterase [Stellaceae bacterium]HXC90245.1 RNA 2',3'-cyclic phosphodiesterase [Stellaceae bacterium]
MLRLFVGIGFPPALKLRLSLLCSGIPKARWVDPGNLHLTLRFIGELPEDVAADVDEALARVRARRFPLQLAGTGVFGGDRPRNLWVGVERNPELTALRDKIEHALTRAGLPPEPRKFAPHVTLARLHNPPVDQIAEFLGVHAGFRAEPLPVEAFSLIASYPTKAGSVYEDQADYPLHN